MATVCEELPPESVMLVYLSASGKFPLPYFYWIKKQTEDKRLSIHVMIS